jgi:hypothetical protein
MVEIDENKYRNITKLRHIASLPTLSSTDCTRHPYLSALSNLKK